MNYPKVLVVAMGRINATDTANNGLLLRNLFGSWPRENLAQIFSGGDNGDAGFFGRYYSLGPEERRFGQLFFQLKSGEQSALADCNNSQKRTDGASRLFSRIKSVGRHLILDTGMYEIIFRLQLSSRMLDWVREFKPDIIFAQGYNLTFSWLPMMLKQVTGARIALLATDDWPTYLYSGQFGESGLFGWLLRPKVDEATRCLMQAVDVPFAFGHAMAEEYAARYGKQFAVLSHSDDPLRFDNALPRRIHDPSTKSIIACGYFNRFRWPLLLDIDVACQRLSEQGMPTRVAALSCGMESEGVQALSRCKYVDIIPDPGNDLLPAYLKSADLLLLAEGFDEGFVEAIRLSVSSKSHLFMFSRRPIIVYAHSETGVSKYALTNEWGVTVNERDAVKLAAAIQAILSDDELAERLSVRAYATALAVHDRKAVQTKILASFQVATDITATQEDQSCLAKL